MTSRLHTSTATAAGLPFGVEHVPGELLYSYVARSCALNSLYEPRRSLALFFGDRNVIPSADLPTHLDAFLEHTDALSLFASIDELIVRATLFPYYKLFMPAPRWESTLLCARGSAGGSLKTSMGLVANGFGASPVMASCNECNRETWKRYGAVCWHQAHHLPGVQVCPEHQRPLAQFFAQSTLSHRQRLVVPPLKSEPCKVGRKALPHLLRFARISRDALHASAAPATPALHAAVYLAALHDADFVRGRSQVRWRSLGLALKSHFGGFDGFPFAARLLGDRQDDFPWLHGLLSARPRCSHPVAHLLLIDFLFGTLERFLESLRARAAGLDDAPAAALPARAYDPVHDVDLSCRQAARAAGLSVTTVVQQRRIAGIPVSERRKTLTPTVLEECRRSLDSGIPLSAVAAKCSLSTSSVYRVLASSAGAVAHRRALRQAELCAHHRERWLRICVVTSGAGIKVARMQAPATFAWLYRNDQAWLSEHRPACFGAGSLSRKLRVDWAARDAALAAALVSELERQRSATPRRRISMSSLVRAVADLTSVRSNARKLPRFLAAAAAGAESAEQFRCRPAGARG